MVVGPVLTAALALVALPGLVGSRTSDAVEPVPVGAFQPLSVPASEALLAGCSTSELLHPSAHDITPRQAPRVTTTVDDQDKKRDIGSTQRTKTKMLLEP